MKSMLEYQKIFNENLLGGISYYLMNNPVISWQSGFIQGLTGLCFLIAIMDAIASIDNSREFAKKILTMALCLVVVLANFGVIDSRSIINFNLSEKYDYLKSAPDVSQTLMSKLNMKNLPDKPQATLDRDVFNALRQFFDGVSSSLRSAMDVSINGGSDEVPIKQTLQTYAYKETVYLLNQARLARMECNVGTSANYVQCLKSKVPFDISSSDKTKSCDGKDCESETAGEESDDGGSWYDVLVQMARVILELIQYLNLIFVDFIFIVFFPICIWLLEAARSVVSLFLIIGYGLGTAGMYLFAKLISPMLLLPKERNNVLSAYRTLYAITLFGFVTDIFVFFTSLLMMGLHYATFQVFKEMFTDAAKAGGNATEMFMFNITFNEILMVVYFTIVVILIINIMALGKIKETCLTIANFSFSKLVSLGGELVTSGVGLAVKLSALVAGAAVAGGAIAAKAAAGAAGGMLKSTATGAKALGKINSVKSAVSNAAKNNKVSKGLSNAWKGSNAEKLYSNAKLGAQQGIYGDQGQKEMFSRNFGDSILKAPESDAKKAEDKKDSLKNEKNENQKEESNAKKSTTNGEESKSNKKSVSTNNLRDNSSGEDGDNFDSTKSGKSIDEEESSTGERKTEKDKKSKDKKESFKDGTTGFKDSMKKYQKMFSKAGDLVSSGAGSGRVNLAESLPQSIESGMNNVSSKIDKKHNEKLKKIYNDENLIEEERRKLDLTDSSVKMVESNELTNKIQTMEHEKDIKVINEMETKIGSSDIYDENNNVDSSKITNEMVENSYKMSGSFSKATIDGLNPEALKRYNDIKKSDQYKNFEKSRTKELNRLVNKASSNSSLGNMQNLSNYISSNNIGKNQLGSLLTNDKGEQTKFGKTMNSATMKGTNETLEKIASGMKSSDENERNEANQRLELMKNMVDLRDSNNIYVGESNSQSRKLAQEAGLFDEKIAKAMQTTESYNKFNDDNKEIIKAFNKGQKEGVLPNGIQFKIEENPITGTTECFLFDGDEAVLETDGKIEINAIRNYDLRSKFTKMKEDLDKIFENPDIDNVLDPSEKEKLDELRKKLV